MIERFRKVIFVCLLGVILFTGCNDKANDDLNDDMNPGVTDNDNNTNNDDNNSDTNDNNDEDNIVDNKIDMAWFGNYLVADEDDITRYYVFDNELDEKITKEFNVNGLVYKFDVEMTSLSKKIEYKIYLNNKLLDTISYESRYYSNVTDIVLFVLDGYVVVGYHSGDDFNIYNLSNYKLVDSFSIFSDMTSMDNIFELTNNSLSFADVSDCPFGKIAIEVKDNDVKISRQTLDLDERDKYNMAGAAC